MHAGSVVCVGSEWHRYPSSFFIPNYVGEVRWLDDGFRGLLPLPFNSTLGGTSAAPSYFNNKNKASDQQFVILPLPAGLIEIYTALCLCILPLFLFFCEVTKLTFYIAAPGCWSMYFPCWAAAQSTLPFAWEWLVKVGGIISIFLYLSLILYIYFFKYRLFLLDYYSKIMCISAYCSTALPWQGVLTSPLSIIFHSIPVAAEECLWIVQAV